MHVLREVLPNLFVPAETFGHQSLVLRLLGEVLECLQRHLVKHDVVVVAVVKQSGKQLWNNAENLVLLQRSKMANCPNNRNVITTKRMMQT